MKSSMKAALGEIMFLSRERNELYVKAGFQDFWDIYDFTSHEHKGTILHAEFLRRQLAEKLVSIKISEITPS